MINNNTVASDDLKAFERRLIEIISHYEPAAKRWRIILMTFIVAASITTYNFISDPKLSEVSISESLATHKYFSLNLAILSLLILSGVHQRIIGPKIIASRIKKVLKNYNMSCDQTGKLIMKRPTISKSIIDNNNTIRITKEF